ncbi:MAG TPA: nitroreductase [Syntrophales bacterium]|jgi:nitroreductase|nr:nitroreductase [Syntrophales bacterium]HOU77318.1 nitroreductase [Syntrophales bacterium]HPC32679.1 nitroreductase [Syntrophales bacterium]HQG33993.1 nitroreductase [Syntrophales bacterium]HQI35254.1 nitroreductase [Syntrophales bacterium]
MELRAAIRGRRSIRKFKPDTVPREVVAEIMAEARWSPSWGNTQPWEFYVLTGRPLAEFKRRNYEKSLRGDLPEPDVPMPEQWPAALKGRYGELGRIVLETLGIPREDKEARNRYYLGMTGLFDAPCLLVACLPRELRMEYAMLDIGLITQTICLAAYDRGLGSCIMAAAVVYADLLREIAGIPADRRTVLGIVLGYPDEDYPLNHFPRPRVPERDFTHWVE